MESSVNRKSFFLGKSYVVGLNWQTREIYLGFFFIELLWCSKGEDIVTMKRYLSKFHTVPTVIYISLRYLTSPRKFHIKTILAFLSGNSV